MTTAYHIPLREHAPIRISRRIGPFYLKYYRRSSWFIWFRSRLFMSYYIPMNAHLGRHSDDVRPRFKFRLGNLSVDYE